MFKCLISESRRFISPAISTMRSFRSDRISMARAERRFMLLVSVFPCKTARFLMETLSGWLSTSLIEVMKLVRLELKSVSLSSPISPSNCA